MDQKSLGKIQSPEILTHAIYALHQSFMNIRLLLITTGPGEGASYRSALDHVYAAERHALKCFEETYGELPPMKFDR